MKKKIILHVGHGKTGSSYLQSCFALNRDKLLDLDIEYPVHRSFERASLGHISTGNAANFPNALLDLTTSSENVLFSNEALFHKLLKENKEHFCDLLSSDEYSFEVVLYSRNLFEHSFSRWGQMVKRVKFTDDVNCYLRKKPLGPHPKILEWIKLSDRYNFRLIIRNYSNAKENLADQFFSDLTGSKDFAFTPPPVNDVNRSLTTAETDFQRVFNNTIFDLPPLSNSLVNKLPGIKSSNFKCSRDVYDFVVGENLHIFEEINQYLDPKEHLEIEPPEKVVTDSKTDHSSLNGDQIKVISEYISQNFTSIASSEINHFRDIAVKISRNKANLVDALWLMEFALKHRPGGARLQNHIDKWRAELN